MIDVAATFEKFADEFLKFERIENPQSKRPDLCAFLLLERLVPGDKDIVSAAEHDEIWLAVEVEQIAAVATEDDIRTLVRCGVRFDDDNESLAMFA
ncbi:MAG: hypothetical protein ACHREM_04140 [Polyangiales bacterium]